MNSNPKVCFSVVLFRANELSADLISEFSVDTEKSAKYGSWTHVGILVKGIMFDGIPNIEKDEWYIYEMTCSGKIANDITPDEQSGKGKFGVQIRKFDSVLQTYNGKIALLKPKVDLLQIANTETSKDYEKRLKIMWKTSIGFQIKNNSLSYQLNPIRLLASAMPCFRWVRLFFPFSKYWKMCSDLAITYLQAMNIIPKEIESENIIPQDFIQDQDNQFCADQFFEFPPILVKS